VNRITKKANLVPIRSPERNLLKTEEFFKFEAFVFGRFRDIGVSSRIFYYASFVYYVPTAVSKKAIRLDTYTSGTRRGLAHSPV